MNDTIPNVPQRVSAAQWSTAIRWGAAIVFVVFGAGKFVNHGSELASFRHYALPAPAVWVYLIGVLEIVGGLLLASGRLVRSRRWRSLPTWSARSSSRASAGASWSA